MKTIKSWSYLMDKAKKYNDSWDFVNALRGTSACDLLTEWDMYGNGNFDKRAGVLKFGVYPLRGWFDIAQDFHELASL